PAWTVESNQAHASINDATAAGDVNGDGYGDVLVASRAFSNGEYLEGAVFLYLGSAACLAASPAWSAEGNEQVAYFGIDIAAAGDVNGDGYGDVSICAVLADLAHVQQGEGAAYVYLGSAGGLSTSPAWSAEGNQRFSGFGDSLSGAGDVNGDGFDDVVVGADEMRRGERGEGLVFVYLGSAAGPSTTPDWTVEGGVRGLLFGSSVGSAGDVNGDGYDDLIVSAPGYMSFLATGRVSVFLGSAGGLATAPAWTLYGSQSTADFALVADAGDLDGDGYDDVLLGSPTFDHGQRDEGSVFAYFGSPAGLATRTAWIVESNQREALFGSALAGAGDVNGDGFSDVLVGAFQFNNGQVDEGRAFAFQGASRLRLR